MVQMIVAWGVWQLFAQLVCRLDFVFAICRVFRCCLTKICGGEICLSLLQLTRGSVTLTRLALGVTTGSRLSRFVISVVSLTADSGFGNTYQTCTGAMTGSRLRRLSLFITHVSVRLYCCLNCLYCCRDLSLLSIFATGTLNIQLSQARLGRDTDGFITCRLRLEIRLFCILCWMFYVPCWDVGGAFLNFGCSEDLVSGR
jgi:hypothetical protein